MNSSNNQALLKSLYKKYKEAKMLKDYHKSQYEYYKGKLGEINGKIQNVKNKTR